ncbi:mandelate racemase/muconate lactonizing enzyme family protein [Psychromarinibacter sp. C21-152]|uniref:Mandelate racemase/muconate lactonizing enzyme family protein n=1 Tax=Psychromarinibacter sediminicola TaxID=3033385 RepID=A0AAE3NZI4_9RHOB|nr:mandelate racemase/muconate lactonizing enzyme family protein [Psychromarinibacter sediminicola]MDF0603795.1 mandelate racemase/muconate lactonizing enzyme family protein [Psychromarinibacter sediminicola]
MKITGIKTFLMQVGSRPGMPAGAGSFRGSRNWLFVKVETDEGVYGIGECSGWPRVIERAVQDLAAVLTGEDPRDIDRLWHRLYVATMGHGMTGTVGGGALTGIEMALWDIKGKVLGQPVWNLLGGRFRDTIPVYGHAKTPERARELMERGYSAVKVGFTGAVDLDLVASIRDTVGAEADVMVDAHGPSWMTAADAIAVGRELEKLDLLFYEDPVAPENLDALQRVRDAVDIPLAAGERVSTIWGIRPYVERDLVDVIQPDTGRAGGITQMRKMAAMAESHYITMAPHSGSLGPVAEFAALHVLATIPNVLMLERVEFDWSGRYDVVTPVLKAEAGALPVPDAPGLGVELVEEEIAKYPSERNVADMPTNDGAYEPGTFDECLYVQPRLRRSARLRLRRSDKA